LRLFEVQLIRAALRLWRMRRRRRRLERSPRWIKRGRRRVHLVDGTPIVLRPLRRGDRAGYLAAFALLSDESRRRRFHEVKTALTKAEIDYLVDVDQRRHVAWCAVAPKQAGVGVARFVRGGDGAVAEFAITVVDDWQHKGVGSALMSALVDLAAAHGVSRLRGELMADNAAGIHLAERLGARIERRDRRVFVEIDVAAWTARGGSAPSARNTGPHPQEPGGSH
jgi:RimJ/RimL family protein N-acetyltransferase